MILFAALLAAAAPAAAQPSNQDAFLGQQVVSPIGHELPYGLLASTIDGESRITTLEESMFADAPLWSPESNSAAPISIQDAVRLSRIVLERFVGKPTDWGLVQVAVERLNRFWYYTVRWRPSMGGTADYFQIPVLFSGRAVAPDPAGE